MATNFISFKYQHTDKEPLSPRRKKFFYVGLVAALLASIFAFPAGFLVFILPLVIYVSQPKVLLFGPRYLICGTTILYYANIAQIRISRQKGILQLRSSNQHTLKIEQNKFPSNARKSYKIQKNQAAKFEKVILRITQKAQQHQPTVEIIED